MTWFPAMLWAQLSPFLMYRWEGSLKLSKSILESHNGLTGGIKKPNSSFLSFFFFLK